MSINNVTKKRINGFSSNFQASLDMVLGTIGSILDWTVSGLIKLLTLLKQGAAEVCALGVLLVKDIYCLMSLYLSLYSIMFYRYRYTYILSLLVPYFKCIVMMPSSQYVIIFHLYFVRNDKIKLFNQSINLYHLIPSVIVNFELIITGIECLLP